MKLLGAVIIIIGGMIGCGPTKYSIKIMEASVALAEAQAIEARKYAPYEYYSAKEYIHKAREEAGYSDFQVAIQYAEKAEKYAKKSVEIAKKKRIERLSTP